MIKSIMLMRKDNLRLRHIGRLFRGERVRVLEIQVFLILGVAIPFLPKMILSHAALMEQPWASGMLAILITIGISQFSFMSLFGAKKFITKHEMHGVMRYNYSNSNKQRVIEYSLLELIGEADEEVLYRIRERLGHSTHPEGQPGSLEMPKSLTSELFSAVAKSWDDDSLLSRFEQLMLHGQAFLEPGLTLGEVAERLHSNKTYVSRLVNNTYNMAFPDLINTMRVDYAEQFIVLHRDARQNEIATACGFTSASSFNNIFKKVTGMTPKIWLATFDRDRREGTGHDLPLQHIQEHDLPAEDTEDDIE